MKPLKINQVVEGVFAHLRLPCRVLSPHVEYGGRYFYRVELLRNGGAEPLRRGTVFLLDQSFRWYAVERAHLGLLRMEHRMIEPPFPQDL